MNRLLNDALALNQKHLQSHQVEVRWEPDGGLPLVPVMPDSIHQVFLNLVMNAMDAMPEGGQLHLSTAGSESPPGVRVVVSDTGSGISPDGLPRLLAFTAQDPRGRAWGCS